jgi:hypothetical protein
MSAPFKEYVYKLRPLTDDDYGQSWPTGIRGEKTNQITKELTGFRLNGQKAGFLSRFEHGLNLIRLLWPKHVRLFRVVRHWKTGESVTVWNHYFMRAFEALCRGKRTCFTGCASSGKTFAVAVYLNLMFMSDPKNTTIMVSTTAGTDAERRVWGELKDLHASTKGIYKVGTLIDYLGVITFDPAKELLGRKDISTRDLRNGISLVPIPKGADGENALGKVIGTKNKKIIWVIDELPHMLTGILRPEENLEQNQFVQIIGIGNANVKTDPHGMMCEPVGGWESVSEDDDEWMAHGDTLVLFFHGERSPNFHPAIDPNITDKSRYPFPYLSTPVGLANSRKRLGRGNEEHGRKTIDYMRFSVGFWYGDDVATTVLSEMLVKRFGADKSEVDWGYGEIFTVAGFDCGWSAGGDYNELMIGKMGKDADGKWILLFPPESIRIYATAEDNEDFRKAIAKQVVEICIKHGVKPDRFGMDINGDGGLMLQAIQKEWKTHECVGLSSLERPEDDSKYDNIVTQYWYQIPDAIGTGRVRGYNCLSGYAKDHFARHYQSTGKGSIRVEKKSDMKKRIKRSPDAGDAGGYMVEMAKRHGFEIDAYQLPDSAEVNQKRLDDLVLRRTQRPSTDGLDYMDHEMAAEHDSYGFN